MATESTSRFVIRPVSVEDYSGYVAVYQEAYSEPPWFEDWPADEVLKMLDDSNKKDGYCCYGAFDDGRFRAASLGFKMTLEELTRKASSSSEDLARAGIVNEPVFYIGDVFVSRNFRRRKIGSALTMILLGHASVIGCKEVILRTHRDLVAAHRLYSSCGFRELALADGTYPDRFYWQRLL